MAKKPDIKPTVAYMSVVMGGKLVAKDRADQKRAAKAGRHFNHYALSHWLGANAKAQKGCPQESASPAALRCYRDGLHREFTTHYRTGEIDFAPARAMAKAIDLYLTTGKVPRYGGR